MSKRASLGDIYDQLKTDSFLESTHDTTLTLSDDNDSPWFVQGLLGCGGWIAAIFLLGSIISCVGLVLSELDDVTIGYVFIVVGSLLTIGTTVFTSIRERLGIFVSQLVLTTHITGHFALVGGISAAFELWQTDTGATINLLILVLIQLIFIWFYQNQIYRFLSILAIVSALVGIFFIYELAIINSLLIVALMILATVIWLDFLPVSWQIKKMPLLQPVGYGAIIGALGVIIYEVSNRYWIDLPPSTVRITGAMLLMCLLWVEVNLLQDYEIALTSRFALSTLSFSLVLGIVVLWTPGILAGLIVILLAFRRRNLILQGIGYIFLAGFIVYYYYWLDTTLLIKSIILMVSGMLLIIGRFGLNQMVSVPEEKGASA